MGFTDSNNVKFLAFISITDRKPFHDADILLGYQGSMTVTVLILANGLLRIIYLSFK